MPGERSIAAGADGRQGQRVPMIGVLVVDDHDVLRTGLRSMLAGNPEIEIVGEADNGWEALEVLEEIDPDVVLLDVTMPGLDGLATLARIRALRPELPVLILSMHDDPAYVEEAIGSGAAGYLLKTVSLDELARAVRAVHGGQGYLQAEVTAPLLSRFSRSSLGSAEVRLSGREREVLQLIADGLSNADIGETLGIGDETVKTYVTSIFRKLGASHRAHAVAMALRRRLIE